MKIFYLSIICLIVVSCGSKSEYNSSISDDLDYEIELTESFAEKIKKDKTAADYLNEYNRTLLKFYSKGFKDDLNLANSPVTGLMKGVVRAIVNAVPLISLEQDRNLLKQEYSKEKLDILFQHEDKITKSIHYSYFICWKDTAYTRYRSNYVSSLEDLKSNDESFESHLKNISAALMAFECNAAASRYHYMIDFQFKNNGKKSDRENLAETMSSVFGAPASAKTGETLLKNFNTDTMEKALFESFMELIKEMENKNYAYIPLMEDWSDKRKEIYSNYMSSVKSTIEWNINMLKQDLSLISPVNFFDHKKEK